jgi:tetratricopeptide (TPR) repeat protein
MLETIREFAAERLEASGEADGVRHRHAGFFMTLAEEAYPNLKGSPKEWLGRLTAEHENLRAALDRLESAGKTQMALQLAGALYRFWSMRGHLREGQGRLARLLSADTTRTPARARALQGAAVLAESDPDTTLKHAEEARDLWRDLGDAGGVAAAEYVIAYVLTDRHEWTAALAGFEASLDAARKLGDDHLALLAGDSIAWVLRELGDRERSRTLHEETLAFARASGNDEMAAFQLWQLAQFAVRDGDHHDAFAMLREALTLDRELGLPMETAEVLVVIAESLHAAGALAAAPRLLGAAARIYEEVGGAPTWAMEQLGEVSAALRADLGDARFAAAWGEGERLGNDQAIELALRAEPPSS